MTAPLIQTLEQLLAGLQVAEKATAPVPLEVPELGGTVYVRGNTTDEWLDPEETGLAPDATPKQKRGWHVARCVCNAEGQRLVKPDNTAAIELFASLPWGVSHRILVAAGVMDGAAKKNG